MNKEQIRTSKEHAFSTLSMFQQSYRKVNLIMDAIRGVPVSEALLRLESMRNKGAVPIHKLVRGALNDADQKQIGGDLLIEHAFASRAKVLKRLEIKGRGRTGIRGKPYCNMTIVLKKAGAEAKAIDVKVKKTAAAKPTKTVAKKAAKAEKAEKVKVGTDGSKS